MKKFLMILVAVIGLSFSANADEKPVKKDGEVVGTVEYSIVKYQPHPRGGGFLVVKVYNNSNESVRVTIQGKRVSGTCYEGFDFRPYQNKEVTMACSDNPDGINVTISLN